MYPLHNHYQVFMWRFPDLYHSLLRFHHLVICPFVGFRSGAICLSFQEGVCRKGGGLRDQCEAVRRCFTWRYRHSLETVSPKYRFPTRFLPLRVCYPGAQTSHSWPMSTEETGMHWWVRLCCFYSHLHKGRVLGWKAALKRGLIPTERRNTPFSGRKPWPEAWYCSASNLLTLIFILVFAGFERYKKHLILLC